jgi:hypothetical protein
MPWSHVDHSHETAGPDLLGIPDGYVLAARNTRVVVYNGVESNFHEIRWVGASGWQQANISEEALAPPCFTSPHGYPFEAEGTRHVVYRDGNGDVHELWWDGSWHHNNLTAASGGPRSLTDPHGYAFEPDGSQHVVYRGEDGNVHELWWHASSGWHHADLTTLAGAPRAHSDPYGIHVRR